jgi:DNA topoisomerase-1
VPGCSVGACVCLRGVVVVCWRRVRASAPVCSPTLCGRVQVAILCNHQRAVPAGHDGQVEKLDDALGTLHKDIKTAKKEFKGAKAEKDQKAMAKFAKKVETLKLRLQKKEIAREQKEELKTIALGTSKLNYLDPRISVAWSMNHDVPIEKVYNATQRAKFRWAVEMTERDFEF